MIWREIACNQFTFYSEHGGATALSTAPGAMISFSEKPEAFMIDLQQDIFEQLRTVQRGPMGLSTNVDAMYRLVLDMMVDFSR